MTLTGTPKAVFKPTDTNWQRDAWLLALITVKTIDTTITALFVLAGQNGAEWNPIVRWFITTYGVWGLAVAAVLAFTIAVVLIEASVGIVNRLDPPWYGPTLVRAFGYGSLIVLWGGVAVWNVVQTSGVLA